MVKTLVDPTRSLLVHKILTTVCVRTALILNQVFHSQIYMCKYYGLREGTDSVVICGQSCIRDILGDKRSFTRVIDFGFVALIKGM